MANYCPLIKKLISDTDTHSLFYCWWLIGWLWLRWPGSITFPTTPPSLSRKSERHRQNRERERDLVICIHCVWFSAENRWVMKSKLQTVWEQWRERAMERLRKRQGGLQEIRERQNETERVKEKNWLYKTHSLILVLCCGILCWLCCCIMLCVVSCCVVIYSSLKWI